VLGQIASIAEKLMGPKLAVQAHESELRQLAPPESAQVFEVIRARILGGDAFEREPSGIAGLAVLVKAQPILQGNLLTFLESLPQNKTGGWACAGWDGAIKDAQMVSRFGLLLEGWSKDGSEFLKAAAGAIVRARKSGTR
jgi:hypothetical protein